MRSYKELHEIFSNALEREKNELAIRQPNRLYEPVIYTLNMGGKRIRPILLLMSHELFEANIEASLPLAMAIEMFHNFTLLHDDIMDGADLRRNNATIHKKYSDNVAILSGDAMSILSYEYLNRCKSKNYRKIFELFTKTALEICEGQQYDMDFETRQDVEVKEYLKMIGLKTAVLLAASIKTGALAANSSDENAELLYEFGYNLGMAFQLQDDYLDSFGTTKTFGKNIGGDIVANKKTFLMLKALELANKDQLMILEKLISTEDFDRTEKIQQVLTIYKEIGIPDMVKDKMDQYYQKSLSSIDAVDVHAEKKKILKRIAQEMMNRKN